MTDTEIFSPNPQPTAINVGRGSRLLTPRTWGNEERYFIDRILTDGRPLELKLSGEVFDDPQLSEAYMGSIAVLHQEGIVTVATHGGGKQIGRNLQAAGIEARWSHDSLRITDEPTLEVVKRTIFEVNAQAVTQLNEIGVPAVGVTDGVFESELMADRPDLLLVGQPVSVHYEPVHTITDDGKHAVLACLGKSASGQWYNQNADTAAVAFATNDPEHRPRRLFAITGVGGIKPGADAEEVYSFLDIDRAQELIDTGVVTGGMATKAREAIIAAKAGVPVAITSPQGLIDEITKNEGEGTLIAEKQVVEVLRMSDVNSQELHDKVAEIFEAYQGTLKPDFLETLSANTEIYLLQHDCGIAIVEPMADGTGYLNKIVVPARERGLGYMDALFDEIKLSHPNGVVWRTWEAKKGLAADYLRLANVSAKLKQPDDKHLIVYGAFPDEIQDWSLQQLMAWQNKVKDVAEIPVTVTYSELAVA